MGTSYENSLELGGARRDRTADLLHAMQALSQLSYSPTEPGTLRMRAQAVKNRAAAAGSFSKTRTCIRIAKPENGANWHPDLVVTVAIDDFGGGVLF